MITKELQQLLQEIYDTNPNLKKNEDKIIDILKDLGALKPDAILNKELKQQIKQEILSKVYSKNFHKISNKKHNSKTSLLNRFTYSLAGMAVAVAILIPLFQIKNNNHIEQVLISTTIEQIEQEAFFNEGFETNKLKTNTKISNIPKNDTKEISIKSLSQDTYILDEKSESIPVGQTVTSQPKIRATPPQADIMPVDDYIQTVNTYIFNGELPSLEKEMNVYKILENKNIFDDISQNITTQGLDLQKFKNLKIDNISFSQDNENGYHIYIDNKGNININRNNEFYLEEKNNLNQNLDKKLAINSSNKFIKEFNLDLSQYGEPIIIQDRFDIMYAEDGYEETGGEAYESMIYPSNNVNILYPYMLDNYLVYEQYGTNLYGVNFILNASNYKVASVYNLQSHKLQASKYELEKDKNILLKQINNKSSGLEINQNNINKKTNKINIELIDPQVQYMKYYTYNNGQSKEFFIPVLIFSQQYDKTTNKKDYPYEYDYYTRDQKIIIPLIKDFDEKFENNDINPILYR